MKEICIANAGCQINDVQVNPSTNLVCADLFREDIYAVAFALSGIEYL